MKTTLGIQTFADAVGRALRATQKHTQLPVLSCILIEVTEKQLILRSTNLEISVSITLPLSTPAEPGVCALPAGPLFQFVQSAKDGDITLSRKNDVVDLKLRNGSATMKTVPNDDFPEFGAVDGETTEFDGQLFSRAARSVMFAASPSMIRPELASVYVSHNQNTLVLVSTDSFRLVEKKMVLEKPVSFDSLMIPAKNMSEILSILPDGHLSLTLSEHNALFSSNGVSVSTRLTSGSYPDYTQILPKEFVSTATVLTKDLMNALKRVTIFSDSFQKITLSIDPKKKEFSISAKNNDLGESKETLDGALTGDTLTIHINHRYFIDVFQALSTDSVRLSFVGEGRPILVEGVGDTSFLYLVMPMNR